jgi:predicted transcriptional regulator YheO
MTNTTHEMRLDPDRHWDGEKQIWRLPSGAGLDQKHYTLRYNSKVVPSDAYVSEADGLRIVKTGYYPKAGVKVLCDVDTEATSGSGAISSKETKERPKFGHSLLLALVGIIPAVLSSVVTWQVKGDPEKEEAPAKPPTTVAVGERKPNVPLNGTPLAAMTEYPVVEHSGVLKIDSGKFMAAVKTLRETRNAKGTAELIYLEKSNNYSYHLNDTEKALFEQLKKEVPVPDFSEQEQHRDRMFHIFKQIVDGVGKTFAGTPVEIVLHDVRNPLSSVVAVQNTISGRIIGCPTTNFGIHLIKWYATRVGEGSSFISYDLKLKSEPIKSTTVPLYDKEYGLIGFVCINVAISQISEPKDATEVTKAFIAAFKATIPNQHEIKEIIDAASKNASPHPTPLTGIVQ